MFDYKLIATFATVVREGGFDKAARVLHITQSAVSQRIKLLEGLAGQVLLGRTTPLQPTAAGQALLKHYLQVKRLEDDLVDEIGGPADKEFASIAVGVNADSLALWLLKAIHPLLSAERLLLDIRVDDQEQTHRLLKNGEVMGCISSQQKPMQGCNVEYLGCMHYRMTAAPDFVSRWFSAGFTLEAVHRAPALLFNRNDALHRKFLQQAFGEVPAILPNHFVPSVEKYAEMIRLGLAYGMLPEQQSTPLLHAGQICDLLPGCRVAVKLYWHYWSLDSKLLTTFTRRLTAGAKTLLAQEE
ncbi:MAG: LysR family transcriptional regulator ArgP [Desulfopila sp.]